jgi:uncharacterized protein YukE
MRPDGLRVDPDAIRELATAFDGAAGWLDSARAVFASRTGDAPPGAFGFLPAAQDAQRAYLRIADEAAAALRSVHDLLGSDLAQGLRRTAATYAETDESIGATMR